MNNLFELPDNFTFLDVETTGFNARADRVIEVGVLKVRNGEVVDSIKTLINPEMKISKEIRQITGIINYDLEKAPTFKEIKDQLFSMLSGALFVAHNAQFDYGFIEQEFLRLDMPFTSPHLCTVKLSRALYPQYKTHNLDAVSKRHEIAIENRHRAYDDAEALWLFFSKVLEKFGQDRVYSSVKNLVVPAPTIRMETSKAQIGFI